MTRRNIKLNQTQEDYLARIANVSAYIRAVLNDRANRVRTAVAVISAHSLPKKQLTVLMWWLEGNKGCPYWGNKDDVNKLTGLLEARPMFKSAFELLKAEVRIGNQGALTAISGSMEEKDDEQE